MRLCLFAVFGLFLTLTGGAGDADGGAKSARQFRIVAYLPDYRVAAVNADALKNVTDCIFFSLDPTAEGGIDSRRMTPAIEVKLQALKKRGTCRFWVTLGGWDRSAGFAPMATEAGKRRRFAQALAAFCLSHGFAGADFDWEHPANAVEASAYSALLTETRRAFAPQGLKLSVTIASWQTLDQQAIGAVDEVNLMAYDHAGRHSTLAQAQADTEAVLAQGVPADKLCLGIPFYGRGIANSDRTLSYADIVAQFHPGPEMDEIDGLYFNGLETVQEKARYAQGHHLGGVMVWEMGQDATDGASLLKAIHQATGKKQ